MAATSQSKRPPHTHIYIIDGTLSRLEPGRETNAGLIYKILRDTGPRLGWTLGYDPGVQADGLQKWVRIAAGTGINESIQAGYAALAFFAAVCVFSMLLMKGTISPS